MKPLDWYETQMYNFINDNLIKRKKVRSNLKLPKFFRDTMGDFKND